MLIQKLLTSAFSYLLRLYFKTKEDTDNMEKTQRLFIKKIKSLENNTCPKVKGTEIVQPGKVSVCNLTGIQVYLKGS